MHITEIRHSVAGLVLAGGKSLRMGTDKALLHTREGYTLLDLACRKIAALSAVWHVSCGYGQSRPPLPCLEDPVPDFGPVAAICKGLENASSLKCQTLLALACDLPFMPERLLLSLLIAHKKARPTPLLTVFQNRASGKLEMLAAVYNVSALPYFEKKIKKGLGKLNLIIPEAHQLRIPCHPGLDHFFFNCNKPEDVACL